MCDSPLNLHKNDSIVCICFFLTLLNSFRGPPVDDLTFTATKKLRVTSSSTPTSLGTRHLWSCLRGFDGFKVANVVDHFWNSPKPRRQAWGQAASQLSCSQRYWCRGWCDLKNCTRSFPSLHNRKLLRPTNIIRDMIPCCFSRTRYNYIIVKGCCKWCWLWLSHSKTSTLQATLNQTKSSAVQ